MRRTSSVTIIVLQNVLEHSFRLLRKDILILNYWLWFVKRRTNSEWHACTWSNLAWITSINYRLSSITLLSSEHFRFFLRCCLTSKRRREVCTGVVSESSCITIVCSLKPVIYQLFDCDLQFLTWSFGKPVIFVLSTFCVRLSTMKSPND